MNITLRKANALQAAIQDQIKTITVSLSVTLNEFQSTDEVLAARKTSLENDKRRADLTSALYAIRGAVGDANATSGVSAMLSKAAYIDKRVAQLKTMAEATVTEDLAIVQAKLLKIANDKSESRYSFRHDTVEVSVLDQAAIDQFKKDMQALKKEKQAINDKVLELNIRTEIQLDTDVVAVLTAEGLI